MTTRRVIQERDRSTGRHHGIHPLLSIAMIVTPIIWLAAEAISPALKSTATAQLAVIDAHPSAWYRYSLLLLLGSLTGIPAAIGLLQIGTARMRRVGAIGGVLVTLGFVSSTVDAASQLWAWQMVKGGADRNEMAALYDRFNNAAGINLLFAVAGIGLMAGTVLLTVALVRSGSVSTWSAPLFAAAVFVNVAAFGANSVPGVTTSCVLLLAGMGSIGARTLRDSRPLPARHDMEAPEPAAV